MKLVSKITFFKLIKFLKWSKIFAKLIAISVTITGAVASLSGYAVAGIDVSALGAIVYIAVYGLPTSRYEITKHIPPGHVNRIANMLRLQEIQTAMQANAFKKSAGLIKRSFQDKWR